MHERPDEVTPSLLREWPLPDSGNSKYDRGRVLVVGGAARTPGAVQLAGLAALRVGAGHLTMAVAASAAVGLALTTPEAGVVGLPENGRGSLVGEDLSAIADDLSSADVVIVGPGLDDAEHTATLLERLLPQLADSAWLVVDAYALGALPDLSEALRAVEGRLVLTPNASEAKVLLDREVNDTERDTAEIAERFAAVVSCQGIIADSDGRLWRVGAGHGGLATSGSGDVLAGVFGELLGRVPAVPRPRAGQRTCTRQRATGWRHESAGWVFSLARSSTSCPPSWLKSRADGLDRRAIEALR